ncbi:MAG: hypothetical protein LAT51_04485 [Flavobacteriaceae bacterium]|nr:hypothetical protein [Flavobacteriaceae bacterium]
MKKIKKISILFITLSFVMFSCSSDDEGSPSSSNFGDFDLTVTGDFEANKSGFADFDGLDAFGSQTWEISMNDNNPSTVSLQFMLFSAIGDVNQPSPGTYEIGFEANSDSVFTAIYAHIPNGSFSETVEYSTLPHSEDMNYGGTLTITTSTDGRVSGNFQFTAAKTDNDFNVVGEISVSGEFNARKRMN